MDQSKEACTRNVGAVKDALYTISGKWKMPIVMVLSDGPMRFNELQRNIEEITPKVLSKELKEMELNGFITRTVDTGTPVAVTYALTPYSESLKDVIVSLRNWGMQHREHLMAKSRSEKSKLLKAV
jgi:DNA-binding HxlR family transcriptional regulator